MFDLNDDEDEIDIVLENVFGWLGELLVLLLWVPIRLSVPESHHPLTRM